MGGSARADGAHTDVESEGLQRRGRVRACRRRHTDISVRSTFGQDSESGDRQPGASTRRCWVSTGATEPPPHHTSPDRRFEVDKRKAKTPLADNVEHPQSRERQRLLKAQETTNH